MLTEDVWPQPQPHDAVLRILITAGASLMQWTRLWGVANEQNIAPANILGGRVTDLVAASRLWLEPSAAKADSVGLLTGPEL